MVVLGLLAPPQVPREVVEDLAAELPEALSENVSDRVSWKVPVIRDPRVPDAEGGEYAGDETIEDVREWKRKEGWDLAVCVTDLPLLHDDGRAVVAEAAPQQDAALVSLPALGVVRRRRHARDAIIRFVDEVLCERLGLGGEYDGDRDGRGSSEIMTAFGRVTRSREDGHLQLVMPAGIGKLRLLAGMVRATRPFRVILGLSYALAAALGTAAFTLITNTIWQLSSALGPARLAALMIVSVAAMILYLIVVHDLWERPSDRVDRKHARLFNAVTVIALSIGAVTFYAALFAATLFAGWFIIDAGVLGDNIGHRATAGDYLALAWMTSALATLGGALGSGLETSDEVREAAYTYHRERRTWNENDDEDG